MTSETGLWRWLKGANKELRADLHMQRVENSVGSGAPDVEGKLRLGDQFWIELKSAKRPKADGPVRFKVRDAQVEWLKRRALVGGRGWLLLQVGSGHAARRYLIHGSLARQIKAGCAEAWLEDRCALGMHPGYRPSPADVVRKAAGAWDYRPTLTS